MTATFKEHAPSGRSARTPTRPAWRRSAPSFHGSPRVSLSPAWRRPTAWSYGAGPGSGLNDTDRRSDASR